MKRRLFNLAAAVSLVLCLATVALWVRGRWVVDGLEYAYAPGKSGQMIRNVWLGKGRVCIASMINPMDYGAIPVGFSAYSDPQAIVVFYPDGRSSFGGFGLHGDRLVIPYWAIALLTAALPLGRLVAPGRRSRALAHLCPACGYDLRATPDRCPECGSEAVAGQSAARVSPSASRLT